ncbi:acid-sensing ion channel 4-A-like isoform X2 [Parasteatoda tepidariorum]|uniref:acid-sensing ion channel 4-A-like isoform X2 n=1 Tax=Parasteatoda tepidariorum TaxID=114398 RepID=UPI0039BC87E3
MKTHVRSTFGSDQKNMDWIFYATPQVIGGCRCKNKTQQNRESYNQSVTRFLLRSLAKSSISGVNSVVSAKNPLQRVVWAVVLVCCLSGFSYQTYHFTKLYNEKPSVVQIEVENDGLAEFPSVTFCNTNRIRRSMYCDFYKEKCKENPNLTLSEKEIGDIMFDLMREGKFEKKRLLGHAEDMVQSCIFNGEPKLKEEECRQNLRYSYDPDYGNCYTIPAENKAGEILQAREADFWQEANDLSVLLDVESSESMEKKRYPGIIVTVHDRNSLPDVHTDGITIAGGSTYYLAIAKMTVLLLPLPYKTNCTNYEELPWDDDPKTRVTSRLCTVGCSQYLQRKTCDNYVTKNLSLFYEKLPYDQNTVTQEQVTCAAEVETSTRDYCRSICGLPCKDTVFEVSEVDTVLTDTEFYNHHIHSHMNRSWEDKMKNLATVKIFYSTLEHKKYRHLPKYNTMELFSYLGGYSGVWLGFSLLTVYELIEIICTTVLFAIHKHKHKTMVISSLFKQKKKKKKTRHSVKFY